MKQNELVKMTGEAQINLANNNTKVVPVPSMQPTDQYETIFVKFQQQVLENVEAMLTPILIAPLQQSQTQSTLLPGNTSVHHKVWTDADKHWTQQTQILSRGIKFTFKQEIKKVKVQNEEVNQVDYSFKVTSWSSSPSKT